MKMLIDETGNKYGMITVLSKAERPDGRVGSFWNVRCECGKEWVVDRTKLSCGQKSCVECSILIKNEKKVQKILVENLENLQLLKHSKSMRERITRQDYICARATVEIISSAY